MSNFTVQAPRSVRHGDHPSQRTANVDLSASNWTAAAAALNTNQVRLPRSFVANVAGTLSFRAQDDSADSVMTVVAGATYAIVIKSITRASCSAPLQVANALTLLY